MGVSFGQKPKKVINYMPTLIAVTEALEDLVVRFPIEGFAIDKTCKCLQFEDNDDCRHLRAKKALLKAKRLLK
jgi:hypothetical protein